ncbi:NTP transferase domain-containing protein [bacterium]|nr:NTP transferase domain-containing protein [bacterium]
MIRQGVILASGLGSRLNSEGRNEPKPLMPVGGMALIERVITLMQSVGIEKIVVVVGYRGDQIREYIVKNNIQGVVFAENTEYNKKNGISLLRARDFLDDAPFMLSMSDHIFSNDFFAGFLEKAEAALKKYDVVLSVDRNIEGVFDLDDATKVVTENGEITTIGKELPSYDAVDTGLFLCKPAVFPKLQEIYDAKGDVSISDVMAVEAGERKFACAEMTGHLWQDVDTPSMKNEAEERLIDNYLEKDGSFGFFSNKMFAKSAKEFALMLFGHEHFDWNLLGTVVFIVVLLFAAVALLAGVPQLSVIPLLLTTFIFYLGRIRNNVRTVPLKNENFIFSWKFNFIIATLPAVLETCGTLFVGLPLVVVMFAVSLAEALKLGSLLQRLELPQISDSLADTYLSPSLFWIVYAVCMLILPEWFVGFIPFAYFIFLPFSGEKRG